MLPMWDLAKISVRCVCECVCLLHRELPEEVLMGYIQVIFVFFFSFISIRK